MDNPLYSTKQYLDAAAFNNNEAVLSQGIINAIISLCGIGLVNHEDISFTTPTALVQDLTFGARFLAIFSDGLSQAHGTTPNADTQAYSVDLTPYVPGTGSQTVYLYLTYFALDMAPYTVVGPPQSHPNYNPTFVPYTAYGFVRDSFSLNAGTAIPSGSLEIARTTLSAGQSGSVNLSFANVIKASSYDTGFASYFMSTPGSPYNAGVGDIGKTILIAQAAGNVLLPSPSTLPAGNPAATFYIQADAGDGAVLIVSPGVFIGPGINGTSSVNLAQYDFLAVQSDGTNYRVISASPNITGVAGQFPSLLNATSGWKKYPDPNSPTGCIIEQWCTTNTGSFLANGASGQINLSARFPIEYGTAVLECGIQSFYPSDTNVDVFVSLGTVNLVQAGVAINNQGVAVQTIYATVWAKGY